MNATASSTLPGVVCWIVHFVSGRVEGGQDEMKVVVADMSMETTV